ncbi:hypothetical protein DM39_6319 [Burkholderia cenocepacia]|uniref:Uncharacterized protein n=1 Tax=Burkholderia cenocepacia TaxID=95486 RepID=A0AAN0RNQ2_9BURK|nr:hypothetical protein DM39_6319 [Burkholderia cenocepacia]
MNGGGFQPALMARKAGTGIVESGPDRNRAGLKLRHRCPGAGSQSAVRRTQNLCVRPTMMPRAVAPGVTATPEYSVPLSVYVA